MPALAACRLVYSTNLAIRTDNNRHSTLGGLVRRGASAKGGSVGPYKVLLYGLSVSPGAPGASPGPPEPLSGSPGRALVTLTVVLVLLEVLLAVLYSPLYGALQSLGAIPCPNPF